MHARRTAGVFQGVVDTFLLTANASGRTSIQLSTRPLLLPPTVLKPAGS